jgi:PAS domain S-box-containing protein
MSQKVKILLIEDNEEDAVLFKWQLDKIEFGSALLVREKSLADGLKRLQGDLKFHVVFLDLTLPDSEGFSTFSRVHSAANSVPIVILTASSETTIIREALSCGAQDYLSKIGLSSEALERSIQHAMWRGSAEQNLQTKVRELELTQEKLRVMNRQLAQSQREHEELLNTIDGVVWEAEISKPTYTYVSNQVEKLLGYPMNRWLTETGFWKSIIHPEDKVVMVGPGYRASLQKHDSQREYRLIKADGETIWIREYIVIIEEDGVPTKMRGIMVDISNRKRAEEVLRKAESEAIRATNLKSDFLAHMSHEIRTPLNAIIGMASLALEGSLSAEQLECMGTIRTAGNTLLMLINDILDFSKIEAGMFELEMSSFKIANIVSQGLDVVSLTARRKNIHIETELDPHLPEYVRGDVGSVLRVLLNLLGNAVKFTPDGGRIDVSMKVVSKTDKIHLIQFEVRDSGVGISQETQDRLFQPFSQADNSMSRRYGGTGLGLSISKQLVHLMKGTIKLVSRVGQGSCFTVQLPLEETVAPSIPKKAAAAILDSRKLSNVRVLVAEDNVLNQRVIKRLLERLECTFEIAVDGRRALEAFVKNKYDLVLMDCQMPELDGYAATQAMRELEEKETRPRTPIVALTAHAFVEDRHKCERAGMDDYLSKPITIAQLESCIQRWTQDLADIEGDTDMSPIEKPIDFGIINRLEELNEGAQTDFVLELIELFQSSGQMQIKKIRQAYEIMDLENLEREAHSFKSACSNIGAIVLAKHMKTIEAMAHEGKRELLQANREGFLKRNTDEFLKAMAELDIIRAERMSRTA